MRDAEPSAGDTSEVFVWLLEREERAYWAPGRTLDWTPEQPAYTGSGERLAELQAGEPVDVRLSALPKWARQGESLRWWRRATVSADGTVRLRDDDGSAWLFENGL